MSVSGPGVDKPAAVWPLPPGMTLRFFMVARSTRVAQRTTALAPILLDLKYLVLLGHWRIVPRGRGIVVLPGPAPSHTLPPSVGVVDEQLRSLSQGRDILAVLQNRPGPDYEPGRHRPIIAAFRAAAMSELLPLGLYESRLTWYSRKKPADVMTPKGRHGRERSSTGYGGPRPDHRRGGAVTRRHGPVSA